VIALLIVVVSYQNQLFHHQKKEKGDRLLFPVLFFQEVLRGKNYICIDTGCCYGNKLTAINLKTLELVEQKTDVKDITP